MKRILVLALSMTPLLGCELDGGDYGEGGEGGGDLDQSHAIDSPSDAERVARELVKAVTVNLPYSETDAEWNNERMEGYAGGYVVVDGERLANLGYDDYAQVTLDTELEFHEYCPTDTLCFDGDVDYSGWIEHQTDGDYVGGFAIQGSIDVLGDYEDTISDSEIMVVANERTYGWIRVGGTTYDVDL